MLDESRSLIDLVLDLVNEPKLIGRPTRHWTGAGGNGLPLACLIDDDASDVLDRVRRFFRNTAMPSAFVELADISTAKPGTDLDQVAGLLLALARQLSLDRREKSSRIRFPRFELTYWLMTARLGREHVAYDADVINHVRELTPGWRWLPRPLLKWRLRSGATYRWFLQQPFLAPRHSRTFLEFARRLAGRLGDEPGRETDGELAEALLELLVNAFLEDARQAYRRPRATGRLTYPIVLLDRVGRANGGYRLLEALNRVRNETGLFDPLMVISASQEMLRTHSELHGTSDEDLPHLLNVHHAYTRWHRTIRHDRAHMSWFLPLRTNEHRVPIGRFESLGRLSRAADSLPKTKDTHIALRWLLWVVAPLLVAFIAGLVTQRDFLSAVWLTIGVAVSYAALGAPRAWNRLCYASDQRRHDVLAGKSRSQSSTGEANRSALFELTVYTSNDNGEPLRAAVLELLDVAGFEIVDAEQPIRGSWFQRMFIRERESGAVNKLTELAEEAVRAAELKYINQPRSESDEREANAIARLAETTKDMDEAVVCTSSILYVKTGRRVLSRVLTEAEIRTIRANPQLARTPEDLLRVLSALTPKPIEPAPGANADLGIDCPTCGHQPVDAHSRWQLRRELEITWLVIDPEAPVEVSERHHCQECRPHEVSGTVACELCGSGALISSSDRITNGDLPPAVLAWLQTRGWHTRPISGLVCANHQT